MTHYLPLLTDLSTLELPQDVTDVAWEQTYVNTISYGVPKGA